MNLYPSANKHFKISILAFFTACCFILTTSLDAGCEEPAEAPSLSGSQLIPGDDIYSESHALVIGAADYEYWEDLSDVIQEINEVEKALSEQGFVVKKVINPDSETMYQTLRDFFNTYGLDEDNRLLFFFSGHGYNRPGKKRGYLVPVDAPNPAESKSSLKAFIRKSVNMEQIMAWSKTVEAKHVMFVFDSCFSGSIFWKKSTDQPPPDIEICINHPVRQFITAGGENDEVPGKSLFTPIFVNGIRGEGDLNGDAYVTGTELYQYIRHEIAYQGVNQTPLEGKFGPEPTKGDFVFTPIHPLHQRRGHIQSDKTVRAGHIKFPNRAGLAMGYTRFRNKDNLEYVLGGAEYTRRFIRGYFDLTLMTSLNSEEVFKPSDTDAEVRFGRAVYLSAGYSYPFRIGEGFSLLIGIGFERLALDLEVDGRADDLTKNSFLLGGGVEYSHRRLFVEAKINAIFGEDQNLGHDFGLTLKTGINF